LPVSEKFPIRIAMMACGLGTGLLVFAVLVLGRGEVVQLITQDTVGLPIETQLWIADLPDGTYLRAGSSDAKWLGRLASGGAPALEREEQTVLIETFIVADTNIREAVRAAMAEKYGLADRMWVAIHSDKSAVIRVESLGEIAATAHQNPHGASPQAQATP
jgi:hypothetical protein